MQISRWSWWAAPGVMAALGPISACGPAAEEGRVDAGEAVEEPGRSAVTAPRVDRTCHSAVAFARQLSPAAAPVSESTRLAVARSRDEVVVAGDLGNVEVREGEPFGPAVREDTFVVQLDACGNIEWLKSFGQTGRQTAVDVGTDPMGNVIVSGTFEGSVDLGTGAISAPEDTTDVFVAKLRSWDGEALWVKHFFAERGFLVGPYSIAVDTSGNTLLLAHREAGAVELGDARLAPGNPGAIVIKLDPEGHTVWVNVLPTGGDESAVSIQVGRHNDVFVAGDDARGKGVFAIALSPPGDVLWKRRFWGRGQDSDAFVALDVSSGDDPVILGSGYFGSIDRPGAQDLPFLTELGTWGDPRWIAQRSTLKMDLLATTLSGTTLLAGTGCDESTGLSCGLAIAEVDGAGRERQRRVFPGTLGKESVRVTDMVADRQGRPVIAGRFRGTLDLAPQPLESAQGGLFVARIPW